MQEHVTDGADQLLTVKEAAARLRVSSATMYALCTRRALNYVRISAHAILTLMGDLTEYVRLRSRR